MGEDNRTDLDLAWEQWIHVLAELRDLINAYHGERGYYRSKRLAERLLNRDFPGLTAAERAYALIPFEPYRSWARAAQEARK